jgi:hypothetical protein
MRARRFISPPHACARMHTRECAQDPVTLIDACLAPLEGLHQSSQHPLPPPPCDQALLAPAATSAGAVALASSPAEPKSECLRSLRVSESTALASRHAQVDFVTEQDLCVCCGIMVVA